MKEHKLDLLGNAVDSLNEALAKYQQAKDGEHTAYKFAILHFAHFTELLLKHCVAQAHPLLVYRDPFKKNLQGAKTIGLWDAVAFLRNDGKAISKDFLVDLEWLKELRNSIEHYEFAMQLEEVEETLGRIMRAVTEFNEVNSFVRLEEHVDEEVLEVFEELADTYTARLKAAMERVEASKKAAYRGVRPKEWMEVRWCVYLCHECGHDTMIPDEDSGTGYRCTFCSNTESGAIEVDCGICGEAWAKNEMWYTDWSDDSGMEYICPRHYDPDYFPKD